MTVGEGRILFLEVASIRQQDLAQIARRSGAKDRSCKSLLYKQRQIARMVDMRVRQNDGANSVRRHWKPSPVFQAQCLETLKQAAIDQNARVAAFDKKFRAGNCASAAKEGKF